MILYLLLINALGFALMLVDKLLAKKKQRRIPEASLMSIAVAGGSPGVLAGMLLARHKTRHIRFALGLPLILLLQILLLYFFGK